MFQNIYFEMNLQNIYKIYFKMHISKNIFKFKNIFQIIQSIIHLKKIPFKIYILKKFKFEDTFQNS